jgi:hypothetical protein
VLEHCGQKWVPVLRKNNAPTQELRAFLRFRLKAKRSKANPEQNALKKYGIAERILCDAIFSYSPSKMP